MPEELAEGPFAQALEMVRRVNFSDEEWTKYERAKMAEQDYWGGLEYARKQGMAAGEARGRAAVLKEGRARGLKEGRAEGLRQAVTGVCEVLGIGLSPEQRSQLAQMDFAQLARLREHLKTTRGWPV